VEVRQERSRWFTVTAAVAIIATSLMVSMVSGRLASGNGGPPPLAVNTSSAHPGMMYVQWHQPEARALRLQWSSDGTNVSEAVLVPSPGTSRNGIIIPNLPVGTYSVTTSVITWHQQSWHATQSAQGTVAQSAAPADCPAHPVPGTQDTTPAILCGTLTGLPSEGRNSMQVYSDGSSSGLAIYADGGADVFTWRQPDDQWPHTTYHAQGALGVSPYMRARIQYLDMAGIGVSQWWAAFGEIGSRFDTATDVLVPMDPAGGPVRLDFDLTRISDFITLSGEFQKETDSGPAALVAADFQRLCVQVFDIGVEQTTPQLVYSQVMCANEGNSSYYDDANPGRWRIKLPNARYVIRFQDEANYYGDAGVLLSNVNFAPEWCCGDGPRAETREQAQVLTTTTSGLNVTLRPAKQLRVDVTDVPAEYATLDTWANIVVGDDFGNWAGGAMVTTSANRWGANVTGLVEGRAYKIFLQFSGSNGAPDRWWLVGGGTREGAAGVVPGPVLTETWQPAPYLVTMHHTDGTPMSEGEGCIAVFPVGSTTQVASNCTDWYGEVPLQRLLAGTYRVIAWTADGQSTLEVGQFEVTTTQTMSSLGWRWDFAVGITNVASLAGELPDGVDSAGAVVMPGSVPPPQDPPPADPPFLVTIHQSNGEPIINGAACIEMEPVGGGTITGPACTNGIGIAVIGPVGAGDHTVRVTNAGSLALTYTVSPPDTLSTFEYGGQLFAAGLGNTSSLSGTLPGGYSTSMAVVLP
jgi:hypothetical protein